MNPILQFFDLIFYQPIYQTLLFLYNYLKDFGLAVISLTILIRLFLFPLNYKMSKEQEKFLRLKKEIENIEKKYKGEEKTKEILSLYQKNKVNPLWSFFSFLIQFPILIALYQVFLKGLNQFDPNFFSLDLSKPNFFLVFCAMLLQIFYFNLIQKITKNKETLPQIPLNYFFALLTFLILLKLPSAISLYFATSYVFLIFQKIIFHV